MMEEVAHHEVSTEVSEKTNATAPTPTITTSTTAAPLPNPQLQAAGESIEMSIVEDGLKSQGGVWGWIKSASSNQFVQKVMEKTKTGVDKMITTLDPGMTPYMREGGDINFVVASDKEVKWAAVRDAFQSVFGTATVTGIAAQSNIAPQPVGYTAGLKGCQERIKYLRKAGLIDENQPCIAVENFIVEQIPDHWFDIGCILLDDPVHNITFELFTLSVPVDPDVINGIKQDTPADYDRRWSGMAVTIGEAIQKRHSWIDPSDWHRALTGRSRRDIIYSASLSLAELYRRKLPEKNLEQNI
ncbi:protein PRRC1-like [Clavelina lepadiformis]|uniref:Non-canonical purine NTP phosphatase/PRRC1 domain-containing protein n=1 Tax=Clavelina lepadiformis TaxID=159417 RepID=A0ABP0EWB8_CLALP